MEQFNLRYFKQSLVIPLIIILGLAFKISASYLSSAWGITLSVFALVSGFLVLINSYLWHIPPFSWLYSIPDLRGKYEGVLSYEFRNENNEKITGVLKQLKTIHQNGSHIVINTQTMTTDGQPSSQSQSQEASIVKGVDGRYSIVLTYYNKGDFSRNLSSHYGTEVLEIQENEGRITLSGVYYTDRQPCQTKGKISVTQTSKKIK